MEKTSSLDRKKAANERAYIEMLVEAWSKIIDGGHKSWVLFRNGTCVILLNCQKDLEAEATRILKKFGSVHPGTSSADFQVISLRDHPGWVVACHLPDVLTYVSPDEIFYDNPSLIEVGVLGREKRHLDSQDLIVVHVESSG